MKRYDIGRINKYEITQEGYLRAVATTARIGIQKYINTDGSLRRELRLPEEVASPASLATFGLKTVTNDHPPVWLDSTNTKLYQVGSTDSSVSYDYGFVNVSINLTDKDTIEAVLAGKQQLSAGYECELDMTPGIWRGQAYDAIQRNINVNHISIVDEGRAGPQAKIHVDTAFINPKTFKARLDSKNMIVEADKRPDEATTRTDALKQKVSDLEARVSDRDDTITQLKAEVEEAKKDASVAKSEALVAKTDLADIKKNSAQEIAKEVNARVDAWNKAKPFLPKQLAENLDSSMNADAIKVAAIENSSSGVKLEGKSSEYVDGMFEAMIATGKKPKGKSMATTAIENAYKATSTPDSRTKAMATDDEMWKITN